MVDEDARTQFDADADPTSEEASEELAEDTAEAAGEPEEEKSDIEKLKEEIRVTTQDVGTLRKKLTITIPRDAIDRRLNEQYDELTHDAVVPGFRKGRAPRRLIEKRFGHDVNDQIRTQLVGQAFLAAVEKEELKTLGDPMIWLKPKGKKSELEEGQERLVPVQEAMRLLELPDEGDLIVACEVEVRPEFELPPLERIPLRHPRIAVSEQDVEQEMQRIGARQGHWEPVSEGPIEADDLVVADAKMTLDGQTVWEEENIQFAVRPQRVQGVVIADFGETLAGGRVGDDFTFQVTIPDDHEREAWQGKTGAFTIKVQDLKRLSIPELDSSFLERLGFDSKQELRDYIRAELESKLGEVLGRALRAQVQQYLLDNARLDLPHDLSQRQIDRAVARRIADLREQGIPDEEIEKRADVLRTSTRDEVIEELKLQFILDRIAEEQEVQVSEEELNNLIAAIARQYNRRFDRVRDELIKGDGLAGLYVRLRDVKILDSLVRAAEITEFGGPEMESAAASETKEQETSIASDDATTPAVDET